MTLPSAFDSGFPRVQDFGNNEFGINIKHYDAKRYDTCYTGSIAAAVGVGGLLLAGSGNPIIAIVAAVGVFYALFYNLTMKTTIRVRPGVLTINKKQYDISYSVDFETVPHPESINNQHIATMRQMTAKDGKPGRKTVDAFWRCNAIIDGMTVTMIEMDHWEDAKKITARIYALVNYTNRTAQSQRQRPSQKQQNKAEDQAKWNKKTHFKAGRKPR